MSPVPSRLLQLPLEIWTSIPPYLSYRDIKSLRLTCKALCTISPLRLDRVFLSANPRNIEVLRAVADHLVLRERVVEIIWDDARLKEGLIQRRSHDPQSAYYDPTLSAEDEGFDIIDELDDDDERGYGEDDEYENEDSDEDSDDEEQYPRWFFLGCKRSLEDIGVYKGPGTYMYPPDIAARAKLADNVSLRKRSWRYYQELIRQQQEVVGTKADEAAFNYGLQHFPALRRVTVTPAAHGFLFRPLYETPMIRAFPRSFNYPIPYTWPIARYSQKLWERTSESEKDTWRAFCIVTRTLAAAVANASHSEEQEQQQQLKPGITEIVVDVNQLLTGLNAPIFDEECTEQRDLATALGQPNFRRLDLALAVGELDGHDWRAFRSGCLRRTLGTAPALEHVRLTTDLEDVDMDYMGRPNSGVDHHFIPLRDIFPIDNWARLSHFGLSRFAVWQDDLLAFLGALPPTLRSVELSFLIFLKGNHRDLLDGMRDQLGWRERPIDQRPRVSIGLPGDNLANPKRVIWGDEPVEKFLYHHGPNPFGTYRGARDQIPQGAGAVVRDSFDPAFERPWVEYNELERLGYIESG